MAYNRTNSAQSDSPAKKSVQIVSLDDDEEEEYEMYQSPGSDFGEQMRRQEG